MSAKTTETISKNVRQAYEFQQKNTVWIGVGRTTAWPDENDPPEPPNTTQALDEIVGLVKPEPLRMVVPDPNGEIEMFAQKFTALAPPYSLNALIAAGARWVCVTGWMMYDQFPVVTYRQNGVYSGVEHTGEPGAVILLPGQVTSYGQLEVITNHEKLQRRIDQKELVEFIIEF